MAFRTCLLYEEERSIENMALRTCLLYEEERSIENVFFSLQDQDYPDQDFSNAAEKYGKDAVLVRVLQKYGNWLTRVNIT